MLAYVIRRTAYGIVTVFGVLLFLFVVFFAVAKPDDVARRALGEKALPQAIERWKVNHGYDKPLWPSAARPADNMLADHFRRMVTFDFGRSDADDTLISERVKKGIGPTLALTVPLFTIGLVLEIAVALFVAFFRETYIDKMGVLLCVLGMSLSILLYIIGAQYLIGKLLRWFPISGFDPSPGIIWRFLALPVVVGLMSSLGSAVRFYRTVFVEETGRDYVRTARAKGAGEARIMSMHVLRNAMIPILTNTVMALPFLFTGSLLLEAFFGIPGLGSMTVDAINNNDFSTLRIMVYFGSLIFIAGQILADISYTLVDPRVRLE
jgi:peptide/nickel transport system permease protein